jgi:CBS domain-containing protein
MSKPLIAVDGEASADHAISLMVEKDIGALVVTQKDEYVGILTERDVMRECCPDRSCATTKVEEIMSKPLIAVDVETPIGVAVERMTDHNIRRLLVTETGKIIGIVTQKDLMRGTVEAFRAMDSALSML